MERAALPQILLRAFPEHRLTVLVVLQLSRHCWSRYT